MSRVRENHMCFFFFFFVFSFSHSFAKKKYSFAEVLRRTGRKWCCSRFWRGWAGKSDKSKPNQQSFLVRRDYVPLAARLQGYHEVILLFYWIRRVVIESSHSLHKKHTLRMRDKHEVRESFAPVRCYFAKNVCFCMNELPHMGIVWKLTRYEHNSNESNEYGGCCIPDNTNIQILSCCVQDFSICMIHRISSIWLESPDIGEAMECAWTGLDAYYEVYFDSSKWITSESWDIL